MNNAIGIVRYYKLGRCEAFTERAFEGPNFRNTIDDDAIIPKTRLIFAWEKHFRATAGRGLSG
jgi:hypothetical protein